MGVPKDEQRQIQQELVQKESWIIDGNYGGTMDIRLQAADTIIFLDFPRRICMYRIMKRILTYRNRTRPDMGAGCPEKFDVQFLKWIWRFPKDKRPGILQKLEGISGEKHVVILKHPKKTKKFLREIQETHMH